MVKSLGGQIDHAIRISVILLAAAGVLAGLLLLTTERPAPMPLSPTALRTQMINLPGMDNMQGGALVENPLFWDSRRPYDAPAEEAEEVSQPSGPTAIDGARLVGVVTSGEEASAVIITTRGERQRIPFGGKVDGWELVSMEPTTATFAGTDRSGDIVERTLSLADSRVKNPEAIAIPNNQRSWFNLDNPTSPDASNDADNSIEGQVDAQSNQDQNG